MYHKFLIRTWLLIFILSACGSNAETIPTSTPIPTLTATSTPQPTATLTLTPSPTVTPIPYTSGVDNELQAKMIAKAEIYMGMTLAEKFEEAKASSVEMGYGYNEKTGWFRSNQLYVGYELISMRSINGSRQSDRLLLAFTASSSTSSTGELYPYILGYEFQGKFYRTSWAHFDKIEDNPWIYWEGINTLDAMVEHMNNRASIGDFYWVSVQTFGSSPDKTIDEWASMESESGGLGAVTTEAILKLIQLQDNDFIARMDSSILSDLVKKLNTEIGDFGFFAVGIQK